MMSWWQGIKSSVKSAEQLKKYTSFKIGGPAEFFVEPKDLGDLKLLLKAALRHKIAIYILGAGSNILVADQGVRGLVLRLSSPAFKKIGSSGETLEAGSGLRLSGLIQYCLKDGLSGLEFLAGIPGTVGGALCMNAGCWGKSISAAVETVLVMDYRAHAKTLLKKEIKFSYRKSSLRNYIILSAKFRLKQASRSEIEKKIKLYLRQRRRLQDNAYPNAGCVFINPRQDSAGRLIDACGLKGKKVGGAIISRRHANFILNQKRSSADDVLKLMQLARAAVRRKFNINLEPEIKIWQ